MAVPSSRPVIGTQTVSADAYAAVIDENEALRRRIAEMEQRARAILGTLNRTASAHSVAREILGE